MRSGSGKLTRSQSRRSRARAGGICKDAGEEIFLAVALLAASLFASAAAAQDVPLPAVVRDRVGLAQIFDYRIEGNREQALAGRDFVWGASAPFRTGLFNALY